MLEAQAIPSPEVVALGIHSSLYHTGGGLVSNVFAVQAWTLEFNPQSPCRKPYLRAKEEETGGSLRLACQPFLADW